MSRNRLAAVIAATALVIAVIVIFAVVANGSDDSPDSATAQPTTSPSTAAPAPSTTVTAAELRFDELRGFDGSYAGEWASPTLGDGSARVDIDVDADAETVAVAFDLDGQLLEALITELAPTDGDVNIMGGVKADFSSTGTASGMGTMIGEYDMTLSSAGDVALTAADVPGPHVQAIEVAGRLEPDCFTLEYRITFEGTETVLEGTIELCRTEDGGIVIGDGGSAVATQTTAQYTVEVLDLSAVDAVPGVGTTTVSFIFSCADGRCDGLVSIGQIAYPDGTRQRGGSRDFTYDADTQTYTFDEAEPGACEIERWYGTITPTGFDDRGPTEFTLSGGHDGSGGCDYQLVYEMTATRESVSP